MRVLSFALMTFGTAFVAQPSSAQTSPTVRILADPSGHGGRVQASITIDAPPSVVWAVMLDCANAPSFVPNLRSCAIESTGRDGASDIRQHQIAWLVGFPVVKIRFQSYYRRDQEIRFERISGDIAEMSGTWRFNAINEGRSTQLTYEAHLVPSRLLPAGLVRGGLQRDTPKVLLAVQREAMRRLSLP
jgi:ribosome-associated toxin RatA of RatAB toxin-antitoxin module